VHLGKFLGIVDKISARQSNSIRYQFEVIGLEDKSYLPLARIPPDALKMYENKRKILTEELFKKY
jgi:hypothetical protein